MILRPFAPGGLEGLLFLVPAICFLSSGVTFLCWLSSVGWICGRLAQFLPQRAPPVSSDDSRLRLQFVALPHGSCCYVLEGDPQKQRVVVFVHGVSAMLDMWDEHRAALHSHGFCTLSFDLYGHGRSAVPTHGQLDYRPEDFSRQLHDLLAALKIEKSVVLVGHSMGGLIAAHYAAAHPAAVAALCFVNAIGLPDSRRASLTSLRSLTATTFAARMAGGIYQASRMCGLRHLAAWAGGVLLASIERSAQVSLDSVRATMRAQAVPTHGTLARLARSVHMIVAMWTFQHALSPRTSVFESFLRTWNPFAEYQQVMTAAASHAHPTLLLWGDKDPLVPVTAMARFQELWPLATARRHPACDHNLPLQRPAFLINELLHFLQRVP